MRTPPRVFWTIHEAAARLNCTPAHICGLAFQGEFKLVTGVTLLRAGPEGGEMLAGLMQLAAEDLLCFMRSDGSSRQFWRVHRVRPLCDPNSGWLFISEPEDGLEISLGDLMIPDSDLGAFEARHGINGSRYVTTPVGSPKYPWEEFYTALCAHVHNCGLPASQKELVEVMADWFAQHSPNGDIPDTSTIKRRVSPVWKALREEASA